MESLLKRFPQVKKCCCGCPLEIGCKLFAWMHFVSNLFLLVMTITFCNVLVSAYDTSWDHSEAVAIMFSLVLSVLVAFHSCIDVVLALILIIGMYQDDKWKMKVWLVSELILSSVSVFLRLINFIGLLGLNALPSEIYGNLAQAALQTVFIFYFITLVKSYYYEKAGLVEEYKKPVPVETEEEEEAAGELDEDEESEGDEED